jgi:mannose-1-phosphate guanylyltransferase
MFFMRASHVLGEIRAHLPALADALDAIGAAIPSGHADAVTAEVYPGVPAISFDYGIMEKTKETLALAGDFGWNDVGSWTALADYRVTDADGNVIAGDGMHAVTHDAHRNIIVGDSGRVVALCGVDDLCVIQAGDAVLVMPRDRAQDVREIVKALKERGLDKYL